MNEKIKKEYKELLSEAEDLTKYFFKNSKIKLSDFQSRYQKWFSISSLLVKQIIPDRYVEFSEAYRIDKRKNIDITSYKIQDYFMGLSISRGDTPLFDTKMVTYNNFSIQINILSSIDSILDNILHDLVGTLEFNIFDNELKSASDLLKNGYPRSAGVICGVILEKHFANLLTNHNLKITKKSPTISDFNDFLKQEKIYDNVNWRFIQRLGDIRNLCGHNKDREPTNDEVQELINGTDKVMKTIF